MDKYVGKRLDGRYEIQEIIKDPMFLEFLLGRLGS